MSLLDKIAHHGLNYLSMKRRTALAKRFNLWRHGHRVAERQRYFHDMRPAAGLRMEDGYCLDKSLTLPHLHEMVIDAERILAENRNPPSKGKDYLIDHLTSGDLSRCPSFLNFATSAPMAAIAANYLGMIPVISVIELWRTEVHSGGDVGSQLFHLDNADDKQVKVFVNLHDIGPTNGPLAFFPISVSRRICDAVNYGKVRGVERLEDDTVYRIASREELVSTMGGRGSVCFLDTVNCLHYGSRRNTQPRCVLMIQYLSPCRADFRQHSLKRYLSHGDPIERRYLLDPEFSA